MLIQAVLRYCLNVNLSNSQDYHSLVCMFCYKQFYPLKIWSHYHKLGICIRTKVQHKYIKINGRVQYTSIGRIWYIEQSTYQYNMSLKHFESLSKHQKAFECHCQSIKKHFECHYQSVELCKELQELDQNWYMLDGLFLLTWHSEKSMGAGPFILVLKISKIKEYPCRTLQSTHAWQDTPSASM